MKKLLSILLAAFILLAHSAAAKNTLAQPGNFTIEEGRDAAELSWDNPQDPAFHEAVLFRSNIPIEDYFTYEAIEALCDKVYEGSDEYFRDIGLAENLPYYYILFAKTRSGLSSKALVAMKKPAKNSKKADSLDLFGEISYENASASLEGSEAKTVNQVSFNEAGIVYNYNSLSGSEPELSEESRRLSLFIIVKSPHDLSGNDKNAISFFIHTGTPTTIILGNGERAGVLNSYLSAFNKLPRNVLEWQDVIKIANGRWPDERNQAKEKQAAEEFFRAIYERSPDLGNANDNAAVTVIAYGLRPGARNLESEKKAIAIYRSIFKKPPAEAVDWDMVRAIAYSGAAR